MYMYMRHPGGRRGPDGSGADGPEPVTPRGAQGGSRDILFSIFCRHRRRTSGAPRAARGVHAWRASTAVRMHPRLCMLRAA